MKKIIAFLMIVLMMFSFAACNILKKDTLDDASKAGSNQSTSAKSDKSGTSGLIAKEYKDKHELYAFVQTFLDKKKPAMEAMEARKNEFTETVAGLAGDDFGVDLPIQAIGYFSSLEKSGDNWEGTASVFEYKITKSGNIYTFTIKHTALGNNTEGTFDISKGELQLTETSTYVVIKYQLKALDGGKYLRFWSEKSNYLEETRANYTYLNGMDVAVGQEETTSPKELIGSNYKDDTYVENDEAWVKLINNKPSSFDGINT